MHLIFDSTGMCHIAKHSMKNFSWGEQQTGIIFGFLRQVLKLATLFDTNRLIFAWDSRKSLRREDFPDYKRDRKERIKTPQELEFDQMSYEQFNMLRTDILPNLGFANNFIQTGLEADDLIARIVRDNRKKSFVVVSTDTDLYQVLRANCEIYNPRSKELYTVADFNKEWGMVPYQWAVVLSVAGCSTDEVPGIHRVGKIIASQFVRGELKSTTKAAKAIASQEGKEIIARNQNLVTLPHTATKECRLKNGNNFDPSNFLREFQRFGFQSFLKHEEFQKWKKAMKM